MTPTVSRAAVRGVYASYLNFAVGLLLSFGLTPIILSSLGPADYGLWTIFTALNGYFLLADFGLTTSVMKYTAEYVATGKVESLNRLLSAVMLVFVGASVLLFALALALVWVIPAWFGIEPSNAAVAQWSFLMIVASAALTLVVGALANVISGHERIDAVKMTASVLMLVNAALSVAALRAGLGLIGLSAAMLFTSAAAIALYGRFIRRAGWSVRFWPRRGDLSVLNAVWPYSLRTVGLGLTSRILYQTDSVVIGSFMGAPAVTPYAIAYKLCFTATYAFSQISSAMLPTFSRLSAIGARKELAAAYLVITRVSMGVMVPIAIGLGFLGQDFIEGWVGRDGVGPLPVLLLLVAMDFVHAVGTPAGLMLQGIGRNKAFIYAETANAVLNLSLSLLLVRPLGTLGVAIGTLAAHLSTSAWVVPMLACRHVGLSGFVLVRRALIPPVAAGAPALLVAWLSRELLAGAGFAGLAVRSALIALTYVGAYFCLPEAVEERAYAGRMLRHRRPS